MESIGQCANQFRDFVFTNFESFKNTAAECGDQFLKNETVNKAVSWAQSYFKKPAEYYPEWMKFSWSNGTAVVTLFTTVFALFAISFFTGGGDKAAK